MLPDSMNIGVIAENIKKLEVMVQEAGSELPTPEAGDVGKILKVGSDGYELADEYSYTPPAYSSTEEVNTGKKWIDGNDVYSRTFTGNSPVNEAILIDIGIVDSLVCMYLLYSTTANLWYSGSYDFRGSYYSKNDGYFHFVPAGIDAVKNTPYVLYVEYTKPAPVPGNETKKKTSKKGE